MFLKRMLAVSMLPAPLFLLISTKPAEATIVQSTTRSYPGFRVGLTWQIGCATTRHYPTAREEMAARDAQEKLITRNAPSLRAAYEHYARGKHPYTRFRRYLRDSAAKDAALTEPIRLRGIDLRLFIARETPNIIRHKMRAEFMLAQMFPGGDLQKRSAPRANFNRMGMNSLTRVLTHFNYPGPALENVLLAAIHDAQTLQDTASAKSPSLARRRLAWRARVLLSVKESKTIHAKMIRNLPTHSIFADAQFLMLLMPSFSPEAKRALRERMSSHGGSRGATLLRLYGPILD